MNLNTSFPFFQKKAQKVPKKDPPSWAIRGKFGFLSFSKIIPPPPPAGRVNKKIISRDHGVVHAKFDGNPSSTLDAKSELTNKQTDRQTDRPLFIYTVDCNLQCTLAAVLAASASSRNHWLVLVDGGHLRSCKILTYLSSCILLAIKISHLF